MKRELLAMEARSERREIVGIKKESDSVGQGHWGPSARAAPGVSAEKNRSSLAQVGGREGGWLLVLVLWQMN